MKLILKKHIQENSDVESFVFSPEKSLNWIAGQFIHCSLKEHLINSKDKKDYERFFTISSAPAEKDLMISTRIIADGASLFKRTLKNLKIGESMELLDLAGDFVLKDNLLNDSYIFIAGGIGISPFRSILKDLEYREKLVNISLFYANRDMQIPFKEDLEEMAQKNKNLKINYIIRPDRIKVQEILKDLDPVNKYHFYVSGPEGMVEELGGELRDLGVEEERIKQDWFPNYQDI